MVRLSLHVSSPHPVYKSTRPMMFRLSFHIVGNLLCLPVLCLIDPRRDKACPLIGNRLSESRTLQQRHCKCHSTCKLRSQVYFRRQTKAISRETSKPRS